MLDGKLLNDFISHIAKQHHQTLKGNNLQDTQTAIEYYDIYDVMIVVSEPEKPISPEWEHPHDKWPRDYDNRGIDPDDC